MTAHPLASVVSTIDAAALEAARTNAPRVYLSFTTEELTALVSVFADVASSGIDPEDHVQAVASVVELTVGEVLFHASNFPEQMQVHVVGRDMSPLRRELVEALVDALAKRSVALWRQDARRVIASLGREPSGTPGVNL